MKLWLKKNWLSILMSLLAALGGADAVAGVRAGKSPGNLTVLPSILVALGSAGTLGVRWLNSRTVISRTSRPGVPPEMLDQLENLFGVAESPDVSPEHAGHLAGMVAALLLGHYRRSQELALENRVDVLRPGVSVDRMAAVKELRKRLEQLEIAIRPVPAPDAEIVN